MSTVQQRPNLQSSAPSSIKIVRIITAIQVIRLAGIQLFIKGQAGIFPSYFAYPFGIGDLFIGLFAPPIAYMLRTGGTRKYALVIAWNSVGMTDLQTALIVVPVSMLLHVVTIALLITKPLKQFFSETSV